MLSTFLGHQDGTLSTMVPRLVGLHVRVLPDLRRRLKVMAAEQGVTVQDLVEVALTERYGPKPAPAPRTVRVRG